MTLPSPPRRPPLPPPPIPSLGRPLPHLRTTSFTLPDSAHAHTPPPVLASTLTLPNAQYRCGGAHVTAHVSPPPGWHVSVASGRSDTAQAVPSRIDGGRGATTTRRGDAATSSRQAHVDKTAPTVGHASAGGQRTRGCRRQTGGRRTRGGGRLRRWQRGRWRWWRETQG